jgi:IS30 family transposase
MAKAGRPRAKINWKQVAYLCTIHCTQREIAAKMGVSVDTLDNHCKRKFGNHFSDFSQYQRQNRDVGLTTLRAKQFEMATKRNNVTMQIWLGKQLLGQKEQVVGPEAKNLLESLVNAIRAPLIREVEKEADVDAEWEASEGASVQ